MKHIFLSIFLLYASTACFCQTSHSLDKDTSKYKNAPLYILQQPLSDPVLASNIIIRPNDIDSINVYKGVEATKLYSEAINGLVIFKTKKIIKMLSFNQLLVLYHIMDKSLPVFIDSAIAYKPENILFQQTMIKQVKIETEKETGRKYVNIQTYEPIHRPAPGEIYLRGY